MFSRRPPLSDSEAARASPFECLRIVGEFVGEGTSGQRATQLEVFGLLRLSGHYQFHERAYCNFAYSVRRRTCVLEWLLPRSSMPGISATLPCTLAGRPACAGMGQHIRQGIGK